MAYYFNLPPVNELTEDQQWAVDEVEPIALTGGPGTGKTVVNLYRHIQNHEGGDVNSLLLTYTKTLEHYLRECTRTRSENAAENIDRTYRWTYGGNQNFYDEIIVDEAQDVEISRYNIIESNSNACSYGADEAQSVYCPRCSSLRQLRQKFPDNVDYELGENFRNSQEILLFSKALFPSILIPQSTINSAESTGIKPLVQVVGWDEDEAVDSIVEIVEEYSSDTHNIGILVASTKQVDHFYDLLKDQIDCSMYKNEMDEFETLESVHITTFKSAKGIEFDTVIIPNFDSYTWFIENSDSIGRNDYYVAITRAKINLFLICKFALDFNDNTYEIA